MNDRAEKKGPTLRRLAGEKSSLASASPMAGITFELFS